jgi:hypothetical protein
MHYLNAAQIIESSLKNFTFDTSKLENDEAQILITDALEYVEKKINEIHGAMKTQSVVFEKRIKRSRENISESREKWTKVRKKTEDLKNRMNSSFETLDKIKNESESKLLYESYSTQEILNQVIFFSSR